MQLNASETGVVVKPIEADEKTSNYGDEDSDSEDQAYQDFLSHTLHASDTDDEDFVCQLNGDDTSDTDSQSSIATEDLSDDETLQSDNVSV